MLRFLSFSLIFIIFGFLQTAYAVEYQDDVINIARTNLASVEASAVNGNRSMENFYYGVLNCFDNDAGNIINNIKYDSWLGNINNQWLCIYFKIPIKLKEVVITETSAFSVIVTSDNGVEKECGISELISTQIDHKKNHSHDNWLKDYRLLLKNPIEDVTKIKIMFSERRNGEFVGKSRSRMTEVVSAKEVVVLGSFPLNTKYIIQKPLIYINSRTAALTAESYFDDWKTNMFKDIRTECIETDKAFKFLYISSIDQKILYSIEINKSTTLVEETPFSELKAKSSAK